jgi:hypothetical protein
MAAPYITTLPQCFPHSLRVPTYIAETIIAMLVKADPDHPSGSSFAVTADAPRGFRNLWLSDASRKTLIDAHVINDGTEKILE